MILLLKINYQKLSKWTKNKISLKNQNIMLSLFLFKNKTVWTVVQYPSSPHHESLIWTSFHLIFDNVF